MKKITFVIILLITMCVLPGCSREASKVSYNLSLEADNFNNVRQITVINCLQGDVIFQMTGKISIEADPEKNQLEIMVEYDEDKYKKHIIGLSDNVTYVVEDITTPDDIDKYRYTLNFNPKMWLPKVKTVD